MRYRAFQARRRLQPMPNFSEYLIGTYSEQYEKLDRIENELYKKAKLEMDLICEYEEAKLQNN